MADWPRLKTLFEQALDQPASARREWLERATGGDQDLLRELEALFEAHDTAGEFLEEPLQIDVGADFSRPNNVGPYTILDEIGRGGMGVVYLAEDERLKRRVALKLLSPAVAANETLRERLRREARAAATISHPAVATVYALEEIDGELVLVSEYIPGTTLREEISRGPLPPSRALSIASDIARALVAAHDAGVVHRDLKPENVILTPAGAVKVVDFGIASLQGDGVTKLTVDGALLGTPAYMAPEQLVGGQVDARTDVYSAGVLLGEMLTGRHPLAKNGEGGSIPGDLEPLIARCLQTDPRHRYASARELLHALEAAAGGGTRSPRTQARWWWEFHQGVAALAYCLAVIPAWTARGLIGGAVGRTFFIVMLAAVIVAAAVRLHLWFTSRSYPHELARVRLDVRRWLAVADWVFTAALIAGSALIGDEGSTLAVVLVSIGIGAAVAFLVIEPATTRAAFRSSSAEPSF